MKRVLVHLETNTLCDIVAVGSEFQTHPSLKWFDAPDTVSHETHIFNGVDVVQKPPKTQAEVKAEEVAAAKAALGKVDLESIGLIRDFIIAKFGTDPLMPKALKDFGALAATIKAKRP